MQKNGVAPLRTRLAAGRPQVWDPVRKQWVALTPEERVRQLFLRYLLDDRGVPAYLVSVEYGFAFANGKPQRADLLVFGPDARPLLLVECKAPEVAVNRAVFEQASRYNAVIGAPYLALTNGSVHYCCRLEADGRYGFLSAVPLFSDMLR